MGADPRDRGVTPPLAGARADRFMAMLAPVARRVPGLALDQSLLTERASALGLAPAGRRSANGSCRLLRARDGWVALNLARDDDVALVAALIERPVAGDPFAAVEAAEVPAATLVERGALLGLPLARLGEARRPAAPVTPGGPRPGAGLRVLDLSALWAGPLCAALLLGAGARVERIENRHRPDRSRDGNPAFYARLNSGKAIVMLDLPADSERLRDAIMAADVVIESSRPRALAGYGIDAAAMVAARPGLIWVSITAHGRAGDATRVGFGDDAAVAGGLVDRDADGAPVFVGDAIADPLGGIAAARAVFDLVEQGRGGLIDVALAAAAAEVA